MTGREKEILELIKADPMISQKDIAEQIGIKRSSVAVHITNLMKKGLVMGKGYVVSESDYVVVIGGSGIDISGFPQKTLVPKTSNPGSVKLSLGGVGRNIAENIGRLGIDVKLLSAVGNDIYGDKILSDGQVSNVDMSRIIKSTKYGSSIYLAIQDENGDMACAISQMDATEEIDISYIQKMDKLIGNARIIVIDTNLNKDVIEYIAENYKKSSIYLDTVSVAKAKKAKECIGSFKGIKPNRLELTELTGIDASTEKGLVDNYKYLIEKGVKEIYVSLGDQGLFYGDSEGYRYVNPIKTEVINANGAGDSFIAGLVYSEFMNFELDYKIMFAMASSVAALKSLDTINVNMSETYIKNIIDIHNKNLK